MRQIECNFALKVIGLKEKLLGAGKMAHQLRALAALAEDSGWIPSIHMTMAHNLSVTPVPEDPTLF